MFPPQQTCNTFTRVSVFHVTTLGIEVLVGAATAPATAADSSITAAASSIGRVPVLLQQHHILPASLVVSSLESSSVPVESRSQSRRALKHIKYNSEAFLGALDSIQVFFKSNNPLYT